MALDLSKLNFFSRLDARARVLVLLGVICGVIFLIYLMTKYFGGGSASIGPSRIANAPSNVQFVPGGTQSASYNKALEQANMQRAQQAQMSGTSAVPTLMNTAQAVAGSCVICGDDQVNVKDTLSDWKKEGKIAPDVADQLAALADSNPTVDEYASQLDNLVKSGKLKPEQARTLLEQYKKQHAGELSKESAAVMDELIKSGQLSTAVASDLLAAQKSGMSTTDYAAKLQKLVDEGKISQATAQKLLAQYTQQKAKEVASQGIANLKEMARKGEITPEAAKELEDLQGRNVGVDLMKSTLDRMVAQGKMTPASAAKILEKYQAQKTAIGPSATVNQMLQQAENDANNSINDLVNSGKLPPDAADKLRNAMQKNVSPEDYHALLDSMVKSGKISPETASRLMADYQKVHGLREMSENLAKLQGSNASPADYAEALKRFVQAGIITPEQAAQLMKEYQASAAKAVVPTGSVAPAETSDFAKLQQRLQEGAAVPAQPVIGAEQFAAVQATTQQITSEEQQQRIQQLMDRMNGQAQQLVVSWEAPTMQHKEGTPESKSKAGAGSGGAEGGGTSAGGKSSAASEANAPVLIKAGTIQFAVLDTAVNSDYPDSPVMATIVDGPLKGAKLLGKLTTVKGVSGQMDRVGLNFTLMNKDEWPKSRSVTAYAIDPDTARTVLASNVNYHYLQRFGAIMATSFVQGYSNAIASSSSTTTTGIFGTSTTHPELSASQKLATAVGQIGTALGNATQNYVNIPPTVKVDSGVGLGILFMSDVT